MWLRGQTGCSAKYSEPSSPCSSIVQNRKPTERCGRLLVRELLRKLEHHRGAHAVVDGAVEDLVVARHVVLAAEMIPMRRIEEYVARMLAARDHADDVARLQMIDGGMRIDAQRLAFHRHRFEARLVGGGLLLLVIEPGALEQILRGLVRHPALDRQHRLAFVSFASSQNFLPPFELRTT